MTGCIDIESKKCTCCPFKKLRPEFYKKIIEGGKKA